VRRNARRSERRGLARDGRITLRRALGIAIAVVAGWLFAAGLLGSALPGSPAAVYADPPTPTPTASPSASTSIPPPPPTPTPSCHGFCFNTPTPSVGPTLGTAPPTATPTPTPAPSPTPTAAPTTKPTGYGESIDPQQTQASIPPTNANLAEVPHNTGSGLALPEWALFAIVVFAVIAGTSLFLFFKIR
jgi:hypothetical protein